MAISQQTKLLPFRRRPAGKKYELVFSDSRLIHDPVRREDITVYRIRALRPVGLRARKNDLGGYVQSLDNLSQEGDAWLADEACATGNSRIWGQAWVGENAILRDQAWAFEDACVYGHGALGGATRVFGQSRVYGNTIVAGDTLISGHAIIRDHAHVLGRCWVSGAARVGGDCWLAGSQILTEGDWHGDPTIPVDRRA